MAALDDLALYKKLLEWCYDDDFRANDSDFDWALLSRQCVVSISSVVAVVAAAVVVVVVVVLFEV